MNYTRVVGLDKELDVDGLLYAPAPVRREAVVGQTKHDSLVTLKTASRESPNMNVRLEARVRCSRGWRSDT